MSKIAKRYADGDFGPAEIKLLQLAYEKARKSLHDTGQPQIVNEIIGERIVTMLRRGERDPDKLCAEAVKALGNKAVFGG